MGVLEGGSWESPGGGLRRSRSSKLGSSFWPAPGAKRRGRRPWASAGNHPTPAGIVTIQLSKHMISSSLSILQMQKADPPTTTIHQPPPTTTTHHQPRTTHRTPHTSHHPPPPPSFFKGRGTEGGTAFCILSIDFYSREGGLPVRVLEQVGVPSNRSTTLLESHTILMCTFATNTHTRC